MTPQALIQARAHFQAGRLEQAKQLLHRFLQRSPSHAEANHSLAIIHLRLGERDQALFFAQRAATAEPTNPEHFIPLASILDSLGHRAKALDAAAHASTLASSNAPLLLDLVPLYWGMGELGLALAAASRAAHINPALARAPYANILCHVGDVDQALSLLSSELAKSPGARDILGALVQTLNYAHDADPAEVASLHRRLGATFPASPTTPRHPRNPDQRLRIGFISPDFFTTSVSYFAEPIIQHLDRRRFEVFCYSSHPYPDATTRRLQSLADAWRDIAGADEAAILQTLRKDAPHILVELAGATTGNVLSIMAARPAPVQVTAIGYPNTTGLPQIDYRIVDAITDPPGSDHLAVERLIRLPGCFLCYKPPEDVPPLLPRDSSRPITFGSFNVVQKLSPPVISTWTRILQSIPSSRLLLKASQFSCPTVRERFSSRFQAAGLAPDRLELLGPIKSKSDHLSAYHRIDIALDPFPYNGTTTTCEALLMGVPVITLAGRTHASRVGASLLTAANAPDLIAPDLTTYISLATNLAADRPRLSHLHQSLRNSLLSSPLCDAPRYAANFGAALLDLCRSSSE